MYRVGIVLLPGAYLSSIGGLVDALHLANVHIRDQEGQQAPMFKCEFVTANRKPVLASCGVPLRGETTVANAGHFDLIYVPAFSYEGALAFAELVDRYSPLLDWLRARWESGATLAANCTGTFVLGATQLLNGHQATTSWWLESSFKRHFPAVRLNVQSLLVEEDRLLTTGALTAYVNLAIQIIERQAGPKLAAICAKAMLIDTQVDSQKPYQTLLQDEISADPLVAKAQYWLQKHLGQPFDLASLAKHMKTSQRTLIRHFKAELNATPLTYLQNLRVETAKRALENSNALLPAITEQVGYQDVSSFTRLFKQRTGLTPKAYRDKFRAR